MPVFLKYRGYTIYFWVNENNEPIHFHIAEGKPTANGTKVWILEDGSFLLANNNGKIPAVTLRRILETMGDYVDKFQQAWLSVHKEIHYYG